MKPRLKTPVSTTASSSDIPVIQLAIARSIPVLADGSLPSLRMSDLHSTLCSTLIDPSTLTFIRAEVEAFRKSFFASLNRRAWYADSERQSRSEQLSRAEGLTASPLVNPQSPAEAGRGEP